ncbi:hypothetical protein D3C87_1519660 [compost metagenome]
MDDACGQVFRPMGFEIGEFGGDFRFKARLDLVGTLGRLFPQDLPALERQSIRPLDVEPLTGKMHAGQRLADFAAMFCFRLSQPHAFKEGDERCRTAGKLAQKLAITARQRQRAGQAAFRKMLHEA